MACFIELCASKYILSCPAMLVMYVLTVIGFCWAQVLLRDPSDENVIPVVEELRRRLAPSSAAQHDGKDNLSGQHDAEAAEEDGKFSRHFLKLQMSEAENMLSFCQVALSL